MIRAGAITPGCVGALVMVAVIAGGCGGAGSGAATTSNSTPTSATSSTGSSSSTPTTPTPTTTVQAVSVQPASGMGAGRTFTFTFSDSERLSNIATTEVWIAGAAPTATATNVCDFYADASQVWLRNDANTAWTGPLTPGASATIGNSQCTIFGVASTLATSGTSVVLTATVTFTATFAGAANVYMRATDRAGVSSAWTAKGSWTVSPLNPAYDVMTSSCVGGARDADLGVTQSTQQDGKVGLFTVTPACFPEYSHYVPQEGWFLTNRAQPVPTMGRTCGRFDVLMVLVDTPTNRQELLANAEVPASVKAKISAGQLQEAMTELFSTYSVAAVMSGNAHRDMSKAIDVAYTVAVTTQRATDLDTNDAGLGFAAHDAVVIINGMVSISAHGVERWPGNLTRPLFYGKNGGFMLHLDPQALTPSLFGHELLQRNVPWALKEYVYGEPNLVRVGNTLYDQTPVINPRTGENIDPLLRAYEGKVPLLEYIAGYQDVDGDNIIDCIDPSITPNASNVDGDFIPDRFDPDLGVNHRPYSWLYATLGGIAQALYTFFRMPSTKS